MADLEKLAEEIVGLTLKEAKELSDILKDKYGIEPAAGGAVMVAAASDEPAEKAEPTEFKVVLKEVGQQKIQVIKVVREITGLGLKEAKEKTEPNQVLKEGIPKEEAESLVKRIAEVGATADVQAM